MVFRLLPVGDVDRRPEDRALVGDAMSGPVSSFVPLERIGTTTFVTSSRDGDVATRREAGLVERYRSWLAANGHDVGRWCIRPPGELRPLWTDLYDCTTKDLYEAKGSVNRNSIRTAIGQLLDYGRYIDDPNLVVLLPDRPSEDLLSLITTCGMSCVYETDTAEFIRHAG
jgi:hypothetical protein